jgi:hypothetical protein
MTNQRATAAKPFSRHGLLKFPALFDRVIGESDHARAATSHWTIIQKPGTFAGRTI